MIEDFKAEHAIELGGDEARASYYPSAGPAYTMRVAGRIVACAGLVRTSTDEAYMWSLTADSISLMAVHRAALRFLRVFSHWRIVSFTSYENDRGCRWHELLGFTRQASNVPGMHCYVREVAP